MGTDPPPWLSEESRALAQRLLDSHQQAFGRPLLAGRFEDGSGHQAAQALFAAATVVLAHDGGGDPRLIYANAAALLLWRARWSDLVGMPSRLTAGPAERAERRAALARASRAGALEGYGGIRTDRQGRRFRIAAARLWTVTDGSGQPLGQAAAFARWWRL
jgi:hypothetical protein